MEPKPNFVALLLLLTLCKSAMARPSTSSPSNPTISFIKSSCRATQYPRICLKTLVLYANNIHRNDHRLAQTALAVTLARAKSTTVFVAKLAKLRRIRRREHLALKDCIENLGDGVDRLAQSVREMNRVGSGSVSRSEFSRRMSDVETWVSAALTDETTCVDGFDEGRAVNGEVKALVRRQVVHVARVTSNALALVNRFVSRHRNLNP